MNNDPLVECMQNIMNSMSKTSAEHDELAHSQQRTSQFGHSPLNNNRTSDSADIVVTSEKALWRIEYRNANYGKMSYVATVMLDKYDQSVQAIIGAIEAAKNKGFRDFGDNWNCDKYPLHDGDKKIPQNAKPENYKGKYYLYARSYVKPIILNTEGDMFQDNANVKVNLSARLYEGSVAMSFFSLLQPELWNILLSCKFAGRQCSRTINRRSSLSLR